MTADFDRGRVDLAREADFQLGPIQVRPAIRQIESGGAAETLEPRIMQVLVVLARRRGEVVSRDELIEACWEGRIVGDDALNRCTSKIRKIGETSGAFRLETIPRVGYRMHVEEGVAAGAPVKTSRKPAQRGWLVPAAAAVAVLIVAVAGLTWWMNLNSRTVTVTPVTTLAILPFDALDSDPDVVRMASRVPRDIADQLSQAGISVKATAQSMAYSGEAKARAAAELGSDLLLDGTVKREGEKSRVSVRVYHAKRGITLISFELPADIDDQLVDDRLSALVARAISWPAPLRLLNSDRPNAVEETRAYLRILQFNNRADAISGSAAAKQFALDAPDLFLAHGTAAMQTMYSLQQLKRPEERAEALVFARKAAARVRELAPRDGYAFLAGAYVMNPGQWADAIAMYREGMKSDPGFTRIENNLADRLLAAGATQEALATAKRARAKEPLSAPRADLVARASLAVGDISGMNEVLDRHEQLWPDAGGIPSYRYYALAWTGDLDGAGKQILKFPPRYSGAPRQVLEGVLKAKNSRKPGDADEALRPCADIAADDEELAVSCMNAGGMLDRPEAAFAGAAVLLPRTHEDPAGEDAWLLNPICCQNNAFAELLYTPWMAAVRADPGIIDVFERLGLLDYWKASGEWPDFCETEPQSVCGKMKAPA